MSAGRDDPAVSEFRSYSMGCRMSRIAVHRELRMQENQNRNEDAAMSQPCQLCGKHVVNPKLVDVPSGAVLCVDCYDNYVWNCDSCGHHVALPDVEGGELEGLTPLEHEH